MKLILTIILINIISYFSKYIIEKAKELIKIFKLKKSTKNFNIEDFNINKVDKDFWNDIENDDISSK